VTGLTGALDRSDRCEPRVSSLIRMCLGCAVAGQFLAVLGVVLLGFV
jgi:hypothetical protein